MTQKKNSAMLKNIRLLATGTIGAQAIIFLTTPFIFRLYSTADLDALSGFSSLFFSAVAVMALRYEQAIPLVKSDSEAMGLLKLCIYIAAATASILGIGFFLFRGIIGQWLNQPIITNHPWLLPLSLFGGSLYLSCTLFFTRMREFQVTARTTILQAFAMVTVQLAGTLAAPQLKGLLLCLGLAAGRSMGFLSFWRILKGSPAYNERPTWKKYKAQMVRFKSFALINSPSSAINSLSLQLPALLLLSLYPLGAATAFYAAIRILGLPMTLLGSAISQADQGEAAKTLSAGGSELHQLFRYTAKRLTTLAIIACAIGSTGVLWLPQFLGDNVGNGGLWMTILAPALAVGVIQSPLSATISLTENHGAQLKLDCARLFCTAGSFLVSYWMNWPPTVAVALYSGALFAIYLISILVYDRCAKQYSVRTLEQAVFGVKFEDGSR
jgi:O-antigen/teichoic acid export membrane protein